MSQFFNLYNHGFIRAAVCIPEVKVADTFFNTQKTIELARKAASKKRFWLFSRNWDYPLIPMKICSIRMRSYRVFGKPLLTIKKASEKINIIIVVGAPLQVDCRLFNCAVVFYRGQILGVAVKSYLPNYREFYEARQFTPAAAALSSQIELAGQKDIPFGADIIFKVANIKNFNFFLEICEDLWVPIPPSSFAAMAGATVIGNLSASNITIGKSEYRHQLAANQSARCVAAYLYAAAGAGESTTDLAWDGHAMIYENGNLLAESARFSQQAQIIYSDIDLDRLAQDRMRLTSFSQNAATHKENLSSFRRVNLM